VHAQAAHHPQRDGQAKQILATDLPISLTTITVAHP
jgi:hypothetical protein